jgi:hypothetical protein
MKSEHEIESTNPQQISSLMYNVGNLTNVLLSERDYFIENNSFKIPIG